MHSMGHQPHLDGYSWMVLYIGQQSVDSIAMEAQLEVNPHINEKKQQCDELEVTSVVRDSVA